jgi:hypothetical protein
MNHRRWRYRRRRDDELMVVSAGSACTTCSGRRVFDISRQLLCGLLRAGLVARWGCVDRRI